MSLGKEVLSLRKGLGMSQRQLAIEAHLSQGYLSRIENGEVKNPSAAILFRLAQALQVNTHRIFVAARYPVEEIVGAHEFLTDTDLLGLVGSLSDSSQRALLQLCSFWSNYEINPDPSVSQLPSSSTRRKKATGNLGGKIRKLRERRELKQGQLASTSGISQGYLSMLESGGVKNPSAAMLLKIAAALEVDSDELFLAAGLPTLGVIRRDYEQLVAEVIPELVVFLETLPRSAQRSLWLLLLDMKDLLVKTARKKTVVAPKEVPTTVQ